MIIYADAERPEAFADVRDSVTAALDRTRAAAAGFRHHEALIAAFIRAGELVQGIADTGFTARGHDAWSEPEARGASFLLAMAQAVERSWISDFRTAADTTLLRRHLQELEWSGTINTRTCEGYAHYALYPESYIEAARRSGLDGHTCVIGIRSIGLGLGALVAAALGAGPPLSLRPTGPPFEREIRADPALISSSAADASVSFAVVDEGPGLSGSSFAAVAQWLIDNGVAPSRISFFPSHEGEPGPAASPRIRAIWSQIRRHVAGQDDILFHRNGLRSWASSLLGSPVGPLRDIPLAGIPRDTRFERRKFLMRASGGTWLLKFAGLGAGGAGKLRNAAMLAEAGFIPPVAGISHGFLIQKWVEGAPLPATSERDSLLPGIGEYLAYRARSLPATGNGASLPALREMAIHNVREAMGSRAGTAMSAHLGRTRAAEGRVRPVCVDGRLHRWEWIEANGRMLKTDAIDHCAGHDLIGCQDIAWDVAGAAVEHDLSGAELAELRRLMSLGGAPTDPQLIETFVACYLAFQLGLWAGANTNDRAGYYEARINQLLGLRDALPGNVEPGLQAPLDDDHPSTEKWE